MSRERRKKTPSLDVVRAEPDARVVALCQELLARARSGDLVSLAVAGQTLGAGTTTSFELGEGDVAHLHLALARLQARLLGLG